MIVIHSYKRGSRSARDIRGALGLRWLANSGRLLTAWDLVLNWGTSLCPPRAYGARWINHPEAVGMAVDKLATFRALGDTVTVPTWTEDIAVATVWGIGGFRVLARDLTRGHGGRGITVVNPGEEVPRARFYTRYRPKADEYRVAVCDGQVFDIQQKRRRHGQAIRAEIRNSENGWVFCRADAEGQPIECPPQVVEAGVRAVAGLGLDFGSVDIGWTRTPGIATVYEVNTAPGLDGSTLDKWRWALRRAILRRT